MSRSIKTKRAARPVWRPTGTAANSVRQAVYPCGQAASRRKLLEQAAEILLVLELPLAAIERVAFDCLFERRLCRAYEGVRP
jgi:hypothetical protein